MHYGVGMFTVSIVEYCTSDRDALRDAEQQWLDKVQPFYNVSKRAYSSEGVKRSEASIARIKQARTGSSHSEATKQLLSTRSPSSETRALMSASAVNRGLNKPGQSVTLTDLRSNVSTSYSSIRAACNAMAIPYNPRLVHSHGCVVGTHYVLTLDGATDLASRIQLTVIGPNTGIAARHLSFASTRVCAKWLGCTQATLKSLHSTSQRDVIEHASTTGAYPGTYLVQLPS